jgi:hypothetical protein
VTVNTIMDSQLKTRTCSGHQHITTTKKLNNRRPTATLHGFRKFDTNCTLSGTNPIYIEFCLGHSLKGVEDSYFLPQPDSNGIHMHDKSPGYLDTIDYLTINEEN